jgi:CRP-like cAMP-binding protein
MGFTQDIEALGAAALFCANKLSQLRPETFAAEERTFAPNEVVFHEGDRGDSAYIVLEGEAELSIKDKAGPRVVARVGRHSILGEDAILCDLPRTATARAATNLTILTVPRDLFHAMVAESPELALGVMKLLARRLAETRHRLRELETRSAEQARPSAIG